MRNALPIKPSADDIFRICRKKYPEGVARVASVVLYWAQFATHHFHGKLGFYKTDADLGDAIGRHGKTAGTNLLKVCTPFGQNNATALFEVRYGPKAGQDSGRCRWLFLTLQGEQIIKAALDDRLAREDAKRGRRPRRGGLHEPDSVASDDAPSRQSTSVDFGNRRPRITPTLNTEHFSPTHSAHLSPPARREISVEDQQEEERAQALKRIPGLWEIACERCGREDLVWRWSHVQQFADEFLEIAWSRNVRRMSDEELLDRLTLLCGNLKSVDMEMSDAFSSHNKSGLTAQSFSKYGDKLLVLAGVRLEYEKKEKERPARRIVTIEELMEQEISTRP
jgi:hypothetical protein